jgi:hypothetical protein
MTNYGTLLRDHVTLRCRSTDGIFFQAYVPRLQAMGDVCTFFRWQRKYPILSSAAFGRIGDAYVKTVYRFAEAHHIPVVHFKKGEKKEETARPYLEAAAKRGRGPSSPDRHGAREGIFDRFGHLRRERPYPKISIRRRFAFSFRHV